MYVFSVLKKINFSRIAVSFIMCTNGGSLIIPVCEIPIITTPHFLSLLNVTLWWAYRRVRMPEIKRENNWYGRENLSWKIPLIFNPYKFYPLGATASCHLLHAQSVVFSIIRALVSVPYLQHIVHMIRIEQLSNARSKRFYPAARIFIYHRDKLLATSERI